MAAWEAAELWPPQQEVESLAKSKEKVTAERDAEEHSPISLHRRKLKAKGVNECNVQDQIRGLKVRPNIPFLFVCF